VGSEVSTRFDHCTREYRYRKLKGQPEVQLEDWRKLGFKDSELEALNDGFNDKGVLKRRLRIR